MLRRIRITQMTLVASAALLLQVANAAEETIRTPSDQMKEAVGKVGKAPAHLGQSLQNLTDAAKEKLRQTFGSKSSPEPNTNAVDLTPPKKSQTTPPPAIKLNDRDRDPFRPMTLRTKTETTRKRENLSPLERLELSQLKLVGIVWDIGDPRAMVEDNAGLGYVVRVGTPIGSNDGKVKAIHRNEVIVEEFYSDDYGARKKRDVGMKLMSE
jgi:Tfp pilus assembly protein PilP